MKTTTHPADIQELIFATREELDSALETFRATGWRESNRDESKAWKSVRVFQPNTGRWVVLQWDAELYQVAV
jgi:hypothetical protein